MRSNFHHGLHRFTRFVIALAILAGGSSPVYARGGSPGGVYTLSNSPAGNEVLVFDRGPDGSLEFQASYATGGLGSGAGLGSQGALVLSKNQRWLFAVNPGSNDVSVFAVRRDGLELTDLEPSGGIHPISLTTYDHLLYVLNDGESGNISGFQIEEHGDLIPLEGSTQNLSNEGIGPAPMPAQVSFTPSGDSLVVTEKGTNLIDLFEVDHGLAHSLRTFPSSGQTPFGFAFGHDDRLIVTEAFGGQPGISAVSSYKVEDQQVEVISPSVATTQTAACWVAITQNGKLAFISETGSSTVSSMRIGRDGQLSLIQAVAGSTGDGSRPGDLDLTKNSQFLYVLSGGTNTISAFEVSKDGSLNSIQTVQLSMAAVGLAAQ